MGWGFLGDAADAVGDAAKDGFNAVVDAGDDAVDTIVEAAEDLVEAAEDALDAATDAIEDIGSFVEDALSELEEVGEGVLGAAEEAWDHVTDAAEDAWERLSAEAQEAWEEVATAVEDAWERTASAVENSWDEISAVAEEAWDAVSDAIEDAWEATERFLAARVDELANLYEWAVETMERAIEWIGDVIVDIGKLFLMLGACLAGQIVYQLAKADNVLSNLLRPVRSLSDGFKSDMEVVFDGTHFDEVFYIDDAQLSANRFGNGTDGMTFAGVTIAGVTVNKMIFLDDAFDETAQGDRELMAHELVHVTQYSRFLTEPAFACAYGVGYAQAGFDYAANPLEAEAFNFVTANAADI